MDFVLDFVLELFLEKCAGTPKYITTNYKNILKRFPNYYIRISEILND